MARSRRKTPISAHTMAESDKPFKQQENRRYRSRVRQAIHIGIEPPSAKLFGNEWSAPKDGKQWLGDRHPHLMRK